MKKILLSFIFLLILSVMSLSFASDYEYDVEGYSDNGDYVYGEIEANQDEKEVEGLKLLCDFI